MSRLAWLVLIAASATITGCGGDPAPPADGTEPVSVSAPEVPEPAEPMADLLPPDSTPQLIESDLPYSPPPLIVPAENAEGDTPEAAPAADVPAGEKPPETEVIED
jgi:hypothetical protein